MHRRAAARRLLAARAQRSLGVARASLPAARAQDLDRKLERELARHRGRRRSSCAERAAAPRAAAQRRPTWRSG